MAVRQFTKPYFDLLQFCQDTSGMEEVLYDGNTMVSERQEGQSVYVFTNDYTSVAYSVQQSSI